MSTPTIPGTAVSVPAESPAQHIRNALSMLRYGDRQDGRVVYGVADVDAIEARLWRAVRQLEAPVSGEREPSSRVAPTGTGPAQAPMRCEQCGRIMSATEERLCRERDETLCFECREPDDACPDDCEVA